MTFFSNTAEDEGGGMFNNASSPSLNDVSFFSNSAEWVGGAMTNVKSNPYLTQVTFFGNVLLFIVGGIYNYHSSPSLTGVTFSDNTASDYAGGMFNEESSPILTAVTFTLNETDGEGGGMYNYDSNPVLKNVTFSANEASDGGGIYNSCGVSTLTNVTFTLNTGGAISNFADSGDCFVIITNSIIWGNIGGQIHDNGFCSTMVSFSDIEGEWDGIGNIDQDPLLGPLADNGGFTLTHALGAGSPAIDAGDPNNCPATDQRGFPRPVDGDGLNGPRCDMGAYEAELKVLDFSIFLPLILR